MTDERLMEIKYRIDECRRLKFTDSHTINAVSDREELYDEVIALMEEIEKLKNPGGFCCI